MYEPIQHLKVPSLQGSFRPLSWGETAFPASPGAVHVPGAASDTSLHLQVCRILHLYLSKAFPDEYAIRDQENQGDESNSQSPSALASSTQPISLKALQNTFAILCIMSIPRILPENWLALALALTLIQTLTLT